MNSIKSPSEDVAHQRVLHVIRAFFDIEPSSLFSKQLEHHFFSSNFKFLFILNEQNSLNYYTKEYDLPSTSFDIIIIHRTDDNKISCSTILDADINSVNGLINKLKKSMDDRQILLEIEDKWLEDYENNPEYLRLLDRSISKWIKYAETLLLTSHEVLHTSIIQEINYWVNLKQDINNLIEEVNSEKFTRALEILKSYRKFYLSFSVEKNLKIGSVSDNIKNIVQILQEIPVAELASVSEIKSLETIVKESFRNLKRMRNINSYSIIQLSNFVRLLLDEIINVMKKVIILYF